ncbi:MAG TPA: hypothetical protein VN700_00595 [Vicinamibacterales bacterium]|nr:hypothetical protein [Vicinamibacterales bacterium]
MLSAVAAKLARYRANDRLTPDQIRDANRHRFREMVRFVSERSPYYRRLIETHGLDIERCTPEDFPPLTKALLITHFDDIVTDPQLTTSRLREFVSRARPGTLFADRYFVMHSSGTSGRHALFAVSQEEFLGALTIGYRFRRTGKPRRSVAILPKDAHYPSTTMARALEPLSGSTFLSTTSSLTDIVGALNEIQPDFLSSYAGVASRLAHEQRAGRLAIAPAEFQVGGEVLYPERRREIEAVFGSTVIDVYASCECLLMGWQSSAMPTMRLLEDDLIFEIHDGFLYCTNLFNRTLPLIRYRLNDHIMLHQNGTSSEVEKIKGRAETPVVLVNSFGEPAEMPPMLPYTLIGALIVDDRVDGIQLALLSDQALECRVVLTDGGRRQEQETLQWIVDRVRGLIKGLGFQIQSVTAQAVEAIPPTAAGKTPALLDLRPRA